VKRIQTKLRLVRKQDNPKDNNVFMLTWLDYSQKVKPGSIISIDDDEDKWEVMEQYDTLQWEDRKLWGLELPKSQRTER
jgi:hypothetical protein